MRKGFGRASGGGHRSAARVAAPLPVIVRTLTSRRCAALFDISETGARLSGEDLPGEGEEVDLTIDTVKAFGTVAWSTGDECGIRFEERITLFDVARLQRNVGSGAERWLTVDQRLALEHWLHGNSR